MNTLQEQLDFMHEYAEQKVLQNKEYEWKIAKLTDENRELRNLVEDKDYFIKHQYEDNEALYEEVFELGLENRELRNALRTCKEALEKTHKHNLGVFCKYCGTLSDEPYDFCPNCGEEMDRCDWDEWDDYMRRLE